MRSGLSIACLFVLLHLVLGGCASQTETIRVNSLVVDVSTGANDDTPIAVDFVAVMDEDLFRLLSDTTAKKWFADREQFFRDYRKMYSIWSLELVPGQFIEFHDFPFAGDTVVGLIVFASYSSPGTHRLRLNESGRVWLRFDSREMRLLTESGK